MIFGFSTRNAAECAGFRLKRTENKAVPGPIKKTTHKQHTLTDRFITNKKKSTGNYFPNAITITNQILSVWNYLFFVMFSLPPVSDIRVLLCSAQGLEVS